MKIHGITGNISVDGILSTEELEELNSSQLNDVRAVQAYWQEHGCEEPYPLIIKPTGYGKGKVVDGLLHPNNQPGIALLIVGTKNVLIEQNQEALRSLVLEETGESRYSILPDTSGPVIVATWQSLHAFKRSCGNLPEIDLAIIDEVHNIGTQLRLSLLRWLKPKKVVGLTATAHRSGGTFRSPEHYGFQVIDEMILTLPECIDKRWLSPLMGLCIDTEVILPKDVMSGNEIIGERLYRELRHHPDLFASIAYEVGTRFLPSGMKTIIVVNRVLEEACVLYKHLEKMGFSVGLAVNQSASRMLENAYVTNGSIARYKLPQDHPDSLQVLISPRIIGEGFDAPATECVVWASPTSSSLRYTQVMGRGARRCPGKSYCLIVDFVYLIEGYGYSMNFAQFFKSAEIKELESGFMYVGSADNANLPTLPTEYSRGGRIVSIVNLEKPIYPPIGEWITLKEIGRSVKRSQDWVLKTVTRLEAVPELRIGRGGSIVNAYSPAIIERVQKESEAIKPIGSWVTLKSLGEKTGRSTKWLAEAAARLGIAPEERRVQTGTPASCVSPEHELLIMLEANQIPEKGEWLSYNDIAKLVDRSRIFVTSVLYSHVYLGEMRREKGSPGLCFPPNILEMVADLVKQYPKQGNWVTVWDMKKLLSCPESRVVDTITELSLLGEKRQGKCGRIFVCYPPESLEEIRKRLSSVPEAGDWLPIYGIAKRIGRNPYGVAKELERLGIKPESRRAKSGRVLPHFSPRVVDEFRKE